MGYSRRPTPFGYRAQRGYSWSSRRGDTCKSQKPITARGWGTQSL